MTITTTTQTPIVRRGGQRIYIVKDQERDEPVVRRVPVSLCAAPPRVNLSGQLDETRDIVQSAPVDVERSRLAGRVRRVRQAVRNPLHPRFGR